MRLLTALSVVVLAAAFAMSVKADEAIHNWSGLYFGGHVGYGWAETETLTIGRNKDGNVLEGDGGKLAIANSSYDADGWFGGAQLGYNVQAGSWVIGVETDYSWADINGSFVYDPDPDKVGKIAGGSVDWLATLRARVGYTFNHALIYGTAGVAFAELSGYVDNFVTDANIERASASSTETGWVVGGGLEYALTHNISLKGEYLYIRFDNVASTLQAPEWNDQIRLHADSDISIQTLRVGVNYKFGG